ncbi:MAG: hypothetical protein R3254_07425 [Thiomicrorhabdus sp.]|nr:hypothetical protein [Thiomicrorhabdus sp.]
MRCPTIKVVAENPQGFMVINESDFDPKTMKEYIPGKQELLKEAKDLGVTVGGRAKPETIMEKIREVKKTLIEEDI